MRKKYKAITKWRDKEEQTVLDVIDLRGLKYFLQLMWEEKVKDQKEEYVVDEEVIPKYLVSKFGMYDL